jgi:uncharacterized protein (TIGR02599 family)
MPVSDPIDGRIRSREIRFFFLSGFTILEILVATAVFMLLVAALVGVTSQTGQLVRSGTAKIVSSQGARAGFDIIAKNIAQATLNTYWRADNPDVPRNYVRSSDLHFLIQPAGVNGIGYPGTGQTVFFQAPLGHTADSTSYGGLPSLLNTVGYYIDYTRETLPDVPNPPQARWRFRLMQMLVPAERMKTFASRAGGDRFAWFDLATYQDCVQPVADNVIALVLRATQPDGEDVAGLNGGFAYDSRADGTPQPSTAHQMPPVVEVVMVALEEASAARLGGGETPPAAITAALQGLFQKTVSIEADLAELEKRLATERLGFRTYRTSVSILESRWSGN